ncbi:MAG: Nif3-like dinuclear metal center hexameric protein [Bacteroidetes bacterium]|nr:Nif3-like dinuclear metal center hexameric protein [Bacteroidota bacterium]MCW5895054.1 Nif3-like dinuclear metal center hexameric protein [Bacteroidota bacterium]
MTVNDVHRLISSWAPPDIAWEKDNVGLQIGNMNAGVKGILVSLDVTPEIVAEAARRKANLLISHHPLLFRPPKSITPQDEVGRCIRALIERDINLYAAHTNLDFTRGGTSFAIAEALALQSVEFLHTTYHVQKKIVTFVPEQHVDAVRDAMAMAGAGIIGNYDHCSFGTAGRGSFRGNEKTSPAIGVKGRLEHAAEIRLEMIVNQWDVPKVLAALREAHPYEEVAYDLYPLDNISTEFGMGIVGTLKRPMRVRAFLEFVKKRLKAGALRRTESKATMIRTVAACGGSGAELTDVAIARGADAFITADVKYHDFHHAHGNILLIDAGHYETERPVVDAVVRRLKHEFHAQGITLPVAATQITTNPVSFF